MAKTHGHTKKKGTRRPGWRGISIRKHGRGRPKTVRELRAEDAFKTDSKD